MPYWHVRRVLWLVQQFHHLGRRLAKVFRLTSMTFIVIQGKCIVYIPTKSYLSCTCSSGHVVSVTCFLCVSSDVDVSTETLLPKTPRRVKLLQISGPDAGLWIFGYFESSSHHQHILACVMSTQDPGWVSSFRVWHSPDSYCCRGWCTFGAAGSCVACPQVWVMFNSKKIATHPQSTPQAIPIANYERNHSLYSLLVKVWGCVPKVCWNNLRSTEPFRSSKWKCKCLASGPTCPMLFEGGRCGNPQIVWFVLHIIHVHVLHPKFSSSQVSIVSNCGWFRYVKIGTLLFSGYPEVTVPLSFNCTMNHQLSQTTKFLFPDASSNLIAEGWSLAEMAIPKRSAG